MYILHLALKTCKTDQLNRPAQQDLRKTLTAARNRVQHDNNTTGNYLKSQKRKLEKINDKSNRWSLSAASFTALSRYRRSHSDTAESSNCRSELHHHCVLRDGRRHQLNFTRRSRAGFKGGPGGSGPRPPTDRGPPSKPFIFFSFVICVCLAFLIFTLLQSPS